MTEYLEWRIEDFPFTIDVQTRWGDNDMLGHLNNVVYNRIIETAVVNFTLGNLGIDWRIDACYPVVIETLCRFHRSLSFPETPTAGLRVARIGSSSVTYEIGIFGPDIPEPAATGHFIHVFIDRDTLKSTAIPDWIRANLEVHR